MLISLHILQLGMLYGATARLFYSCFGERLRFPRRKLLCLLIPFLVVLLVAYAVLAQLSCPAALVCFLLSLPTGGAFLLLTVREKPQKSLVVLLLVVCYGPFLCGCSVFIANLVFDKGLGNSVLYTVATLFLGAAPILLPIGFWLKRSFSRWSRWSAGADISLHHATVLHYTACCVFLSFTTS